MLKIGLTGNIGSGKSTVAGVFRVLGVPVYHADEESKKFLAEPAVRAELTNLFGPGILSDKGGIDRKALASVVFNDAEALKQLNALLHPLVMEDFREWTMARKQHPFVIQEAAILFESGFSRAFDYIIHVSCPKEKAIDRVVRRDGVDGHEVARRMAFQLEDEEKRRLSDFVIVNDDEHMVIPQVLAICNRLSEAGTQREDDVAAGSVDA